MHATTLQTEGQPVMTETRFVEILTDVRTGDPFGYALGGGRPGPNVMVAGFTDEIENLFHRLNQLPSLPWMWGKLYLVDLDAVHADAIANPRICVAEVPIDELLLLPSRVLHRCETASGAQSYLDVLQLCARLGMISGRGLAPARPDWASDTIG